MALVVCLLAPLLSLNSGAVQAAPAADATTPSLYLAGDSTMALHPLASGIQGWGNEIPGYLTGLTIVNRAVSGSSARSFARDGHFHNIVQDIKPGDYFVVELGHNDGGLPTNSERAPVGGDSLTTSQTVTLQNGTVEDVHTFPWYIEGMIAQVQAKGATPIVSSQTPNDPYYNVSTLVNVPPRFVKYAKDAATAANVAYVDHFTEVICAYSKLGKAAVDAFYPRDHTHTDAKGATVVAQAFASGLQRPEARGVLSDHLKDTTSPSSC